VAVGDVVVERDQGAWILTLRGEHDLSTEPSLADALTDAFAAGSNVVVDLSEVEFIDSTILRALAYGRREAIEHDEHNFAIAVPPDSFARRVLALTGIDQAVPTFETRAQALAALNG
jgi:anti-sigma B factor antagonist